MANLAKRIYDHYETYLGDMLGADFYPEKNIQLMGFQDAVEGCLTLGTMGLSLHKKELGGCCEAVMTAEQDLDLCAEIQVLVCGHYRLAAAPQLFFMEGKAHGTEGQAAFHCVLKAHELQVFFRIEIRPQHISQVGFVVIVNFLCQICHRYCSFILRFDTAVFRFPG